MGLWPQLATGTSCWHDWSGPGQGGVCTKGSRTRLWESVLCVLASRSFQICLALSVSSCPCLPQSPCLPLPSSLSYVLGLFVSRHLCFILGNLVWGCKVWGGWSVVDTGSCGFLLKRITRVWGKNGGMDIPVRSRNAGIRPGLGDGLWSWLWRKEDGGPGENRLLGNKVRSWVV